MKKALVSLSGGLDSSVCFYWALKNYSHTEALFFNYGQKALASERSAVEKLCSKNNVTFKEIDLRFLGEVSKSSLNKDTSDLPYEVNLTSKEETQASSASVWVPNRNGLFINVLAAVAEAMEIEDIIVGFNKEEAETFPDNSKEFIQASNEALKFSSQERVTLKSPTVAMDKVEILRLGLDLGLDLGTVWPCYQSGDSICGRCESCQRFLRAKEALS